MRRTASSVTFGSFGVGTLSVDGKFAKNVAVVLAYRYGFNGKELDPVGMGGGGSTYDYGFRIYNAQIAKFLSVDPLTKDYPWYTPYQFAGNKPINSIDLDGLEEYIVIRVQYNDKPSVLIAHLSWNQLFPGQQHGKSPTGTLTVIVNLDSRNFNRMQPTGQYQYIFTDIDNNTVVSYSGEGYLEQELSRHQRFLAFERRFEGSHYHSGDTKNYDDAKGTGRIAIGFILKNVPGLILAANEETKRFRSDNTTLLGASINYALNTDKGDKYVRTVGLAVSIYKALGSSYSLMNAAEKLKNSNPNKINKHFRDLVRDHLDAAKSSVEVVE